VNGHFSVNVYGLSGSLVEPIKVIKEEGTYHTDLLMLIDKDDPEQSHFIYIYDLDLFLKEENNKKYHCKRCLHGFTSQALLKDHLEICKEYPAQAIVFPDENSVNYKIGNNQILHPLFVVADFETWMKVWRYFSYSQFKNKKSRFQISINF